MKESLRLRSGSSGRPWSRLRNRGLLAMALALGGALLPLAGQFRAPKVEFVLDIPEANTSIRRNQSASIPHEFINRLRIEVSSSKKVEYSDIFSRINGQAANIVMSTSRRGQKLICSFDLNLRSGFRLRPGRNSVEIQVSRTFSSHLGTFLILVGEASALGEIRTETHLTKRGGIPPQLHLIRPAKPLDQRRKEAFFEGYLAHPEKRLRLTIGGNEVPFEPFDPQASRALARLPAQLSRFYFHEKVRLPLGADEIRISVSTLQGAQTDVVVPVYSPLHSAPGQRLAVVIGVSRYRNPSLELRYASKDARTFRDFLIEKGNFLPGNVVTLLDEDATIHSIRTALFTFLARAAPDDQVLLYFAGHGDRDPNNPLNLYLLPYDTDLANMGATALPMWRFQDLLAHSLRSKNVTVLVDACHSAAAARQKDQPYNVVNQLVYETTSKQGHAVMTASDIGEFAQESSQWEHGIFTYFLLQALEGRADSDGNGELTVGEVFDYVSRQVSEQTGGKQNPVALAGSARLRPLIQSGG